MQTIGERAAQAIRERAERNKITLQQECEKLNVSRKSYHFWNTKGINPGAYFLQQMVLQGYDVIWILTGVKGSNGK